MRSASCASTSQLRKMCGACVSRRGGARGNFGRIWLPSTNVRLRHEAGKAIQKLWLDENSTEFGVPHHERNPV